MGSNSGILVRLCLGAVIFMVACRPSELTQDEAPPLTEINLSLRDSTVRKILDLQDRSQTDSLRRFFTHDDPTYRYLAASAFASVRTDDHIEDLSKLLQDPVPGVAQAAAYALGQIGSDAEAVLLNAFNNVIDSTESVNTPLNATILEAIGKCGSEQNLNLISQASTYQLSDDHLLLGQARAIYRYMQRGIVNNSGTGKMVSLLADPNMIPEVRMLAANYLSRAQVNLEEYPDILSLAYTSIEDPEIKLFLPLAMTKTANRECIDLLRQTLRGDVDFRVKCNALKALAAYDFATYRNDIQNRLRDQNIHVATTASEMILQQSPARYWKTYMTLSLGNYPWQVKSNLLHTVSKLIPAGNDMFSNINQDLLRQRLSGAQSPYEKSLAIKGLGEYVGNFSLIIREMDDTEDYIVRNACMEALVNMTLSNKFRWLQKSSRQAVVDRIMKGLKSADVAQVEIATRLFTEESIDFNAYNVDPSFVLNDVLTRLELPRDIEAYVAVKTALSRLYGTPFDADEERIYTHAIEWPLLLNLEDTVRASIQTSRGPIELALYPLKAPGTVANFIDLAKLNYYAGKTIHRVVPGFVIQGGCNRGDGYGSMDYNIRSELGQQYYNHRGMIGMASAGNHTESAQWFITQSATPHLDGNYTIFGEVIYGMDIVNQIEVGDVIESVAIR